MALILTATIVLCSMDANSATAMSGYDENTQVVIHGTVIHISNNHPSGFRYIILKSGSKQYQILTAPNWYAKKIGLNFHPGSEVQVVGSKFYTRDGQIYLMARSIKSLSSGRYIALRDNGCNPLWEPRRKKGRSCMRIFFHPRENSF